jgi:hypothetical protein
VGCVSRGRSQEANDAPNTSRASISSSSSSLELASTAVLDSAAYASPQSPRAGARRTWRRLSARRCLVRGDMVASE